jgi:hypothetical protein
MLAIGIELSNNAAVLAGSSTTVAPAPSVYQPTIPPRPVGSPAWAWEPAGRQRLSRREAPHTLLVWDKRKCAARFYDVTYFINHDAGWEYLL